MALFCSGLMWPAAFARDLASVEKNGISVAFSIKSLGPETGTGLSAGEPVSIHFTVKDSHHAPLTGLFPAAWIHPSNPQEDGSDDVCIDKAKTFIGGSLFSRAELDLNVYHVLTLNQDATISVVDPLFGFGGSKLLTMLSLSGPGYDWALSPAADQMFVSVPSSDEIAQINTASWQVTGHSSNGQWRTPTLLSLPSGQQFLWALVENGIAIFDRQPFVFKKTIVSQASPIALKFSTDGRFAYALSKHELQVIDTRTLSPIATITLGEQAVSMDYSSLADELYISHAGSGEVWVIDGRQHVITGVIKSEPGIGMLRFAPNGRWAMLVNPVTDRLSIIDAAKQKIVQSGRVADGPEYIAFSDNLGYIRHAGSSDLHMISLDDDNLGREGMELPTVDTPGGDQPPGLIDFHSGSEGIVQAPGSNAVLISNYHDKAVYFYKEGMAAPMGHFNNYGKSPRAVLVVDHSLAERHSKGVYSTSALLPGAGSYQAVYFMDSPRVVHCFPFKIEPGISGPIAKPAHRIEIEQTGPETALLTGEQVQLEFQLRSNDTGVTLADRPFDAIIVLSSGLWRQRLATRVTGDNKIVLDFAPPLPGTYDVHLAAVDSDVLLNREKFSFDVSP